MIRILLVVTLLSMPSLAAITNKTEKASKVEKEKKTEHLDKRLTVKERDKGSKKESDWQIVKEYTLMFKNNKKAKKVK